MTSRDTLLEEFLMSLPRRSARAIGPEAAAAIDKTYEPSDARRGSAVARRLPVCRYLPEAIATARAGSAPVARVAGPSRR